MLSASGKPEGVTILRGRFHKFRAFCRKKNISRKSIFAPILFPSAMQFKHSPKKYMNI
jgi:hypothetical protein